MHIIKDGRIVEDRWHHLADDEAPASTPFTVSFARWTSQRDELLPHRNAVGVRLGAEDKPEGLAGDLSDLPLIVLQFDSLRDGRSFSHARILRERLGYAGEIRARGEFIRDQVFFLSRLGVDSFEFADDTSAARALPALRDFSAVYQPASGDQLRDRNGIGSRHHPRY
jgi:uncharacterized protein (DUF934 family)